MVDTDENMVPIVNNTVHEKIVGHFGENVLIVQLFLTTL